MYWRLSSSVTACIAAGRIILLDLDRDRYFSIPERDSDAVAAWLRAPIDQPLQGSARSILIEAVRSDTIFPVACALSMPIALDAEPLARVAVDSQTLFGVATATFRAWRDVRNCSLSSTIGRRVGRRHARSPSNERRTARLARFRSARPLIPIERVCLHDCLALFDWLGPDAANCQLVLGVSAYPFAAHSWLQHHDRVIDDHPDSVSRFTPIVHFG